MTEPTGDHTPDRVTEPVTEQSREPKATRALVLGGGGITGIAWETGFLAGLAEAGLDLTGADRVIGTSAGSIVGAQITSLSRTEEDLAELYRRQLLPPSELGDGGVPLAVIGPRVLLSFLWTLLASRGDAERFGRLLGRRAVKAAAAGRTPPVDERYAQVRKRLTSTTWPDRDLIITAVDVETGRLAAFGPGDGVGMEDAVNSSCAVPCVYPPIGINGRLYVDGGIRSGSNADLAQGCDVVVALCPVDRAIGPMRSAQQLLADLGVPHLVVNPDAAALAAIGKNVLDPAARPASARAGYAQAAAHIDELRELWE